MAHAGRNTGGSQFYICYQPQPHLDKQHTVFGKVTKGMEYVDALKPGSKMTEVKVWDE
jgi:peptidyl-prolyl cis-trans isomerase B (cyclophilin B)